MRHLEGSEDAKRPMRKSKMIMAVFVDEDGIFFSHGARSRSPPNEFFVNVMVFKHWNVTVFYFYPDSPIINFFFNNILQVVVITVTIVVVIVFARIAF